jgi:hypothetical protein
VAAAPEAGASPPARDGLDAVVGRAWEAWTRAQQSLRQGDWAAYGEAQKRLEEALRALRERGGAAPPR